jgi:predicted nucleic acid-binding protein
VVKAFVLDTSAWIAFEEAEPGAADVEAILAEAWQGRAEAHGSFVTLTELEYIRTQERDARQAAELLAFAKSQPVHWHHSDEALCSEAAKLKAAHKVSFADAFVAATAQRLDAVPVHKDPEFNAVSGVVQQHMLPPK